MFNLPEFLYPLNKETPKKPNPKAGMPEFLCDRLVHSTKDLQAVKTPQALIQQLVQDGILWLDLELASTPDLTIISTANQPPRLLEGAFVINDCYWRFDTPLFMQYAADVLSLIEHACFLGGHNIIEFDLPYLHQLLAHALSPQSHDDLINHLHQQQTLSNWQHKAWDTLILSCLLIPHQPSHALAKLYKAKVEHNDPVQDCAESREVFRLCQQAWQILPSDWQILLHKLLPQLSQLNLRAEKIGLPECFSVDNNQIFDLDTLFEALPEGNEELIKQLLRSCLAEINTQAWQHLGTATFMNWLRFYDKPQARRPVWISKHPIHQQGFHQAEQTYWQLDEVSETWINQQAKKFFGFDTLRDGQMQIVKAVLNNKDVPLGILPTGGGKSLTFQLPALILSHYQRQLTVIVSPLKALIEDQVIDLHVKLPDYESRIAYLTSGQTPEVQQEVMTGIWQGDIDIIYLRSCIHKHKFLNNCPI